MTVRRAMRRHEEPLAGGNKSSREKLTRSTQAATQTELGMCDAIGILSPNNP